MKAIQRVKQYIDKQGYNNSSFEKKNNLSNGYIGTQIKRNADLGEGILNKILDNCLDLNPEWLLTGNGTMLKQEIPQQNIVNVDYKEKFYKALEEKEELFKEKDKLYKQVIELKDKNTHLLQEITQLEQQLKDVSLKKKAI